MKVNLTLSVETADGVTTTSTITEKDFTASQLAAIQFIFLNRGKPADWSKAQRAAGEAETAKAVPTMTQREMSVAQGFTGDSCISCGGFSMKRNGTCLCCTDCGSTTGCS